MVPHLVTALSGPLLALEEKFLSANAPIERWFRFEWQERTPPFYCAVDLCNAGYKLAPLRSDLFPNCFNHLAEEMLPLAIQAAVSAIEKYCPDAKGLLFIPDHESTSDDYWANVLRLTAILKQTGLDVRYGAIDPRFTAARTLKLKNGREIVLEPLARKGKRVGVGAFDPCAVLLNHPLPGGLPVVLSNLYEQVLLPPLHAASSQRKLSQHLLAFDEVANRFAKSLGIDPWLIKPFFSVITTKNPSNADAVHEPSLTTKVEVLFKKIKAKYKEHGVRTSIFVTVRPDCDARDLSSVRINAVADIPDLVAKGLIPDHRSGLVIQEGLESIETVGGQSAQATVLMVDRFVVGGFYEVSQPARADTSVFKPLPFSKPCNMPDCGEGTTSAPNRFYAYGVIARLSLLAAALELERTDPDQSQYG